MLYKSNTTVVCRIWDFADFGSGCESVGFKLFRFKVWALGTAPKTKHLL